MTPGVAEPGAVGHYAGPLSRLGAYAVDAVVVAAAFSAGSAVVLWMVQLITARQAESVELGTVASAILFAAWFLLYFGGSWVASGRTLGMALFGLRVVCRDGSHLAPGRAVVRAIIFPLSFVPFGLGFTGIVVGRERRAFHDVCARTTVVYDWDVRSARLKSLARHA